MVLESFIPFVILHKWVFIFYASLILLIVAFRDRLDWQGIVGMYRTKVGIKLMDRWGKDYRGLVQLLGYIGVGVGFVGMLFITGMILKGVFDVFTDPTAPPVVSPVIPGVSIPGTDMRVPLITGWLALFVVIVIHEFSHGVVSRAHDVKVKSSGLLVFGPVAGAFVEPDEEQLVKREPIVQYSLFAAGPFSNIATAFIFLFVWFLLSMYAVSLTSPAGIELASVTDGGPAAAAGLVAGTVVTSLDDDRISGNQDFIAAFEGAAPGDTLVFGTTEGTVLVTVGEHPERAGDPYLGINFRPHVVTRADGLFAQGWRFAMEKIALFFYWTFLLSLGIGLANLLPLGPVDGGRMLQAAARQIAGNNKRADWYWKHISIVVLIVIVGLLIHAMLRWWI